MPKRASSLWGKRVVTNVVISHCSGRVRYSIDKTSDCCIDQTPKIGLHKVGKEEGTQAAESDNDATEGH